MSFINIIQDISGELLQSKAFLDTVVNAVVKPQNTDGISGWVFDIPQTENINLSADVTDHYTENNSYINDHIVIKPIEITLTGLIGELVYRKPQGIEAIINVISNSLTRVTAFLGEYTDGLSQAITSLIESNLSLSAINQRANQAKNLISAFDGEDAQTTTQRRAYKQLESMMITKQAVTVQTPWAFYENMFINSISASQNEDSKSVTDFSISLKQMRFAELKFTKFDENLFPIREQEQSEETKDSGIIKGRNSSFLFDAAKTVGAL